MIQMCLSKRMAIILFILFGLTFMIFFKSQSSSAWFGQTEIIKLYAGDKLVATWTSSGPGQLSGNTYLFPVRIGVNAGNVRVSGTFSVEPAP